MNGRPRTVSSVFTNLERLLTGLAPRSAQVLLGARWGFTLPHPHRRHELVEYSFPPGLTPFVDVLAARTGLHIREHHADAAGDLQDHLVREGPAIVAVDSFYLPYRPAFGRVHSHRTILVGPGLGRDDVWIDDPWPPGYSGPLSFGDLEPARHSTVPLVPRLEPIFAGRPIDGEWYSVRIAPILIEDPGTWAAGVLRLLHEEATVSRTDGLAMHGIAALWRLRQELAESLAGPSDQRFRSAREASLLLRAELSSRVYLCAFLRAAAGWMGRDRLREEAGVYYEELRAMEMVRDILTKSLTQFRPDYVALMTEWLAQAIRAEERLARYLASISAASSADHGVI